MDSKVDLFEKRKVRHAWHKDEWWFVIADAVFILTDSTNPAEYFKKLRKRDSELGKLYSKGGGQIVPPLAMKLCKVLLI